MENLNKIQKELKVSKGQFNSFGNYKYRSCEDILEVVKPLLGQTVLTISDEMVQLGDRYYVKATVTLTEGVEKISVSAYARESLDKKGMDSAQITGAASSYARKYALNGLFCIDDTKDADTQDNSSKAITESHKAVSELNPRQTALKYIEEATTVQELQSLNEKIVKGKTLSNDDKTDLVGIIMNKLDKLDPLNN